MSRACCGRRDGLRSENDKRPLADSLPVEVIGSGVTDKSGSVFHPMPYVCPDVRYSVQ